VVTLAAATPHGVEVAFRVLQGREARTRLGLRPHPSRRLPTRGFDLTDIHSPTTPCDATRMTILSWRSPLLQGFTHSTRRAPLDARHLYWGSRRYSASGGRSLRCFCQRGPSRQLRSVLRVRALSTVCSSTHLSPAFRRRNAPAVLPPGVSPLEQACELVALRFPLLAFLPRPGLSSPRKKRTAGASATFLGSPSLTPFTAYRVLLRPRVRAVRANRLSPLVGRSPPGLSPP